MLRHHKFHIIHKYKILLDVLIIILIWNFLAMAVISFLSNIIIVQLFYRYYFSVKYTIYK